MARGWLRRAHGIGCAECMIPSRPLSLAEVIAETFGITRRILLRYWLLFAILILPGAVVITIGMQQFAQSKIAALQGGLRYTDSALTVLRDEMRHTMRERSEFFALEEQVLGGGGNGTRSHRAR